MVYSIIPYYLNKTEINTETLLDPYRLPRALGNIEPIFMDVGSWPRLYLVNSGSLHTHNSVLNSYYLCLARQQYTIPIFHIDWYIHIAHVKY